MSLRLPPEEYAVLCNHVLNRDGWRCRYQGCGVRANLHVHHLWFRSQQGPDEDWNLITLCNVCHVALHAGDLVILDFGEQVEPWDANYEMKFMPVNGWRPH